MLKLPVIYYMTGFFNHITNTILTCRLILQGFDPAEQKKLDHFET